MRYILPILISCFPFANAECPAVNGAISFSGPCTYENIKNETGCELNEILGFADELKEACNAAAFKFSSINNDETRNFDETYFNGGGPFNNDHESDGPGKEMVVSASRLARIQSNIAPRKRILMPEYDSLLNYTYLSYFGPDVVDKNVYVANATARDIMDKYPPYLPNFNLTSECQLNSIMCCFVDDRKEATLEDNADVCTHDLSDSPKSNHIRHGFGIYDSNVPTYCTAFKWDDDENSPSFQYRGNALFDISFGTFLEKGYVKNVPGAPMCSCIENMPVVTNSACRKVDVANEEYTLSYDGSSIKIVQDSVEVKYSDCGEDFKTYHYAKDMEDIVLAIDEHIVDSCDNAKTEFLNERFLISGKTDQFTTPSSELWQHVAGKGLGYYPTKSLNNLTLRDTEFRAYFDASPNKIIYRHCHLCRESHRHIYYRRHTPVPSAPKFNFLDLFLNNWFSTNNKMHDDFDLFSTYEDALAMKNKWTFCNYDDAGVGFPRDCAPSEYVPCQWISHTRGVCGPTEYRPFNHAFYVERASSTTSNTKRSLRKRN